MRALIAALIITLAIAVTASVFAIWPVVADAPWEKGTTTSSTLRTCDQIRDTGYRSDTEFDWFLENCSGREPSRCEALTQQLVDAQTERATIVINRLGRDSNCW